jgi:hypothetical protein
LRARTSLTLTVEMKAGRSMPSLAKSSREAMPARSESSSSGAADSTGISADSG